MNKYIKLFINKIKRIFVRPNKMIYTGVTINKEDTYISTVNLTNFNGSDNNE